LNSTPILTTLKHDTSASATVCKSIQLTSF